MGGTFGADTGPRNNDLFVMEQSSSPHQEQGLPPPPVLQQQQAAAPETVRKHVNPVEDASEEESQQTSIQGLPSPSPPQHKTVAKPQPPVRPCSAAAAAPRSSQPVGLARM